MSFYEQVTGRKDFTNQHPIQRVSRSITSSPSNCKTKQRRDPMTHRIIEKRRRDKMNTCLSDLSHLIPSAYMKRGRNRIEKTEIIEMAIKHLKHLQSHTHTNQTATSEIKKATHEEQLEQYRLGYQESMSESIRYLVEIEGLYSNGDTCMRLVHHLQKHYDKILQGLSSSTKQAVIKLQENKNIERMQLSNNKTYKNGRRDQFCTTNNSAMRNDHPDQFTINRFFGIQDIGISPLQNQHSTIRSDIPKHDSNIPSTTVVNSPIENRSEEFYKFKKTIKERFVAELQQPEDTVPTEKRTPSLYKCCLPKSQQSEFIDNTPTAPSYESHSRKETGKETIGAEENSTYYRTEEIQLNSTHVPSNLCTSRLSQSTGGSSSGYNTDDSKYKNTYSESSPSTSYDSPSENSPASSNSNSSSTCIPRTPIFALHPTGNFYIPLAISTSSIESCIHSFDDSIQSLHPVNICVNFNYSHVPANNISHARQSHRAAKKARTF